ncbi:MAG: hypothetical protein IBX56_19985 [Methylomicrobium sp.]|nr:hypothetical protein [Methylomicrobium sp.]
MLKGGLQKPPWERLGIVSTLAEGALLLIGFFREFPMVNGAVFIWQPKGVGSGERKGKPSKRALANPLRNLGESFKKPLERAIEASLGDTVGVRVGACKTPNIFPI